MSKVIFRPIRREDNPAIARIVRDAMTEFGCDPATTVLSDPALDYMFENYDVPRAAYFVAEVEGVVVGGSGVKQLDGADATICELQRMFLHPEARGKGIGKRLMDLCLQKAVEFGYRQIYLESFTNMTAAQHLYRATGFQLLDKPWGATGHTGCNVWMAMELPIKQRS